MKIAHKRESDKLKFKWCLKWVVCFCLECVWFWLLIGLQPIHIEWPGTEIHLPSDWNLSVQHKRIWMHRSAALHSMAQRCLQYFCTVFVYKQLLCLLSALIYLASAFDFVPWTFLFYLFAINFHLIFHRWFQWNKFLFSSICQRFYFSQSAKLKRVKTIELNLFDKVNVNFVQTVQNIWESNGIDALSISFELNEEKTFKNQVSWIKYFKCALKFDVSEYDGEHRYNVINTNFSLKYSLLVI